MGNVDGKTNVGKVEAVGEGDEGDGDDVVEDEFFEILAWLFELEEKDNGLLGPVGGLEEVVCFKVAGKDLVRVAFVEGGGVEIPHGGVVHDPETKGAEDCKVEGGVGLFHEAIYLSFLAETEFAGEGSETFLGDEFAGEAEDGGIEGDKFEIVAAFCEQFGSARFEVLGGLLVGDEDEWVEEIGFGGIKSKCS